MNTSLALASTESSDSVAAAMLSGNHGRTQPARVARAIAAAGVLLAAAAGCGILDTTITLQAQEFKQS